MVRRKLEAREIARGHGRVWVVEKLKKEWKPCQDADVYTDARIVRKDESTGKRFLPKHTVIPKNGGSREDLRVWVPELDQSKQLYLHRLVAFAFRPRGEYEDVGGKTKKVRAKAPTYASMSKYEVDHGGTGARHVLSGKVRFCTKKRNLQLQRERGE